jgi:hypothetical protein
MEQAKSKQLKAEQTQVVTTTRNDNTRATLKERILLEMSMLKPNMKQDQFINNLKTALRSNHKRFNVTNIGGSDDTLDPVG